MNREVILLRGGYINVVRNVNNFNAVASNCFYIITISIEIESHGDSQHHEMTISKYMLTVAAI
ncbi:MAG: hypothetical protein FIO02_04570 [Nitrosopumilales archaeon]|nr:hypothetical protein [Nitrosopumilales archaeon]